MNSKTKAVVARIPLCKIKASPRDGPMWNARLKEELTALIAYVKQSKEDGTDWFHVEPTNEDGTLWKGKVWWVHELLRYEFDLHFELPVTYPATAPELMLPALDGLTAKMYRGGKICQDVHFRPLWTRNVPKFGIAHALALGMSPWLAAEIPILAAAGSISPVTSSAPISAPEAEKAEKAEKEPVAEPESTEQAAAAGAGDEPTADASST